MIVPFKKQDCQGIKRYPTQLSCSFPVNPVRNLVTRGGFVSVAADMADMEMDPHVK